MATSCKTRPRTMQGPACLPGGSESFRSAFLCTIAGYATVSLLLCSFRITDRPVLRVRTIGSEKRKSPTGHLVTAVILWPEVPHLGKGKARAAYSLAMGTSLSSHMGLPEGSSESAPALTDIFYLLKKRQRTSECHLGRKSSM